MNCPPSAVNKGRQQTLLEQELLLCSVLSPFGLNLCLATLQTKRNLKSRGQIKVTYFRFLNGLQVSHTYTFIQITSPVPLDFQKIQDITAVNIRLYSSAKNLSRYKDRGHGFAMT